MSPVGGDALPHPSSLHRTVKTAAHRRPFSFLVFGRPGEDNAGKRRDVRRIDEAVVSATGELVELSVIPKGETEADTVTVFAE